ncbi:MAG: hypothetical protein RSE41_07910 [Clostridia bacterium]
MLNINEIVKCSKGKLINGNEKIEVIGYHFDSRLICINEFFIPLVGEKVDSHKYILDLVKFGIVGYFIESNNIYKDHIINESIKINKDINIIEVDCTKDALYNIALYNRDKHIDIPIIAITGSVR